MRMLLTVSIPVKAGNAAAKDATLGSTVERFLAGLKPEAAYFFADANGDYSGWVMFDVEDTSEMPAISEPCFLAPNAKGSLPPQCRPGRPAIHKVNRKRRSSR
jgi:hypothetical protein